MNEMSNRAGVLIRQIQERLSEGGRGVKELPELIDSDYFGGDHVNLYPSEARGVCHEVAYFFAFKNSRLL